MTTLGAILASVVVVAALGAQVPGPGADVNTFLWDSDPGLVMTGSCDCGGAIEIAYKVN